MTEPQVSPDGKWQWDGEKWIPRVQPRKRRPWLVPVVILAVVALLGAFLTIGALSKPSTQPETTATTAAQGTTIAPTTTAKPVATQDGSCAPQPCANDNYGWIVAVSNLKFDASSGNEFETPEKGNVYVTLQVTFTNKLPDEHHANPVEFVLLDGAGIKHTVTSISSCEDWSPVNLTTGATLGPKCLAFEATAGKPAGLVLVWTPSFAGGGYNIKLS